MWVNYTTACPELLCPSRSDPYIFTELSDILNKADCIKPSGFSNCIFTLNLYNYRIFTHNFNVENKGIPKNLKC